MRKRLSILILFLLGIGIVVGFLFSGKMITKTLLIHHQRGIRRELADWEKEYSNISTDAEAGRAVGMLEYVKTYYVVGEGYSSNSAEDEQLESQRKKTIEAISDALQKYKEQQANLHR